MIICLSPGYLSISIPMLIFSIEAVFIIIKKHYILGRWKRPLFNKILAILICSCFLTASFVDTKSQLYEMLPFAILLILMATVITSAILAIKNIYYDCK